MDRNTQPLPMPRLLKKLSRKSLRKRSQSTASSVSIDVQPLEVPPLPIPKSASTASFGYAPNRAPYLPPPLPFPAVATAENPVPQDDFSKDLQGAWASATTDPKVSKADKVLLNGVAGAMVKETKGAVIVEGIKTGLEAVGGMEVIEQGLNAFMEGMPVLMNALDEVAKLHPCGYGIQGRVGARAETSRERLKNTCVAYGDEGHDGRSDADPEEVAPDGTTIKGRMQEIAKGTADDIKACANVHLQSVRHIFKEKAGSQGLEGPIWEGKLVKFVGMFSKASRPVRACTVDPHIAWRRCGQQGHKHGRQDDAGEYSIQRRECEPVEVV
ncbi:hypothetical protein B0H14DRAFT_3556093 [Mycena olivaceomarginata]|nr:hypothetical protein B0H14DRAFT_3556093 [Mycena olivaceomarginata]